MKTKFILAIIFVTFSLPAHAGQGTIQETDTQIIIEYSGGEDDVKASETRQKELDIQRKAEQEEIKKKDEEETLHQQRMERAKLKGANKAEQYEKIK